MASAARYPERRNPGAYRNDRTNRTERAGSSYMIGIEGNTVRKLDEQIIELPEKRGGEQVRRARRTREKALQMSPAFVMFLSMACAMVVFLCVGYMKLQTSVNVRIANIEQMEAELSELKTQNGIVESRIAVATDVKAVYQEATEGLGMKYPTDDQVIYYSSTEREYVQQYENIPTQQ